MRRPEHVPSASQPPHWTEALPADLAHDWDPLLRLLGEHALMLHPPDADSDLSGSDFDCAVMGLDPSWPTRLTGGWALCQQVHYDLLAWYWVLEREGEIFALDTVVDPEGLGRDGFPTRLFMAGDALAASPGVRAAYLTSKRIRKRMLDAGEWDRIGELARSDEAEYHGALGAVVGSRLSGLVGTAALLGEAPEPRVARRAHRLQLFRRFRTPPRALHAIALGARRTVERVLHPTGILVAIVGPDGVGKSTLAAELPRACLGLFRRHTHSHWRPGVLPRPGALFGRPGVDASQPHAREPHGRVFSFVLLLYFWCDFLLGSWTRYALTRVRSGLVVVERGWWDIAADPLRYRLSVPTRLVRWLGRAIPRPDIALRLDGPLDVLLARKRELDPDELARQLDFWSRVDIARLTTWRIDASKPPAQVTADARAAIVAALEQHTAGQVGGGWVALRSRRSPRWYLPRRPRRAATAALGIYQPVTRRARRSWALVRALARSGGFRALPRGKAPPRRVRELVAPYAPPRPKLAVARTNHPDRYVVVLLDSDGRVHALAKVATDDDASAALAAEASATLDVAARIPEPLVVPRILANEPGIVLYEWVPWRSRRRPWLLPDDVWHALGVLFGSGRGAEPEAEPVGPVHGDLAPWNVLRTDAGWALVDWESASVRGAAFSDVCHFFVQSHVLLRRPGTEELVAGFTRHTGAVGRAVLAFADGAGISPDRATRALHDYLTTSGGLLLDDDRREHGLLARERILERLERA